MERNAVPVRVFAIAIFVLATLSGVAGCDEGDGDDEGENNVSGEYLPRAEALLLVENQDSPVDVLAATETTSVAFGGDDEQGFLLEASEQSVDSRFTAVSSTDGDDLLLDAEEYSVRYTDDGSGETGEVELLDSEERVVASRGNVQLSATERLSTKQTGTTAISSLLTSARAEWETGRWSDLIAVALELAEFAEVDANALEEAYDRGSEELASLTLLVREADPANALPAGVTARPNLYNVPESNQDFATGQSYEDLLNAGVIDTFSEFAAGVGEELRRFARGERAAWAQLPATLTTFDGELVDTLVASDTLRFSLVSQGLATISLRVISPDGDPRDSRLPISIPDPLDGTYVASATYLSGEASSSYELLAYYNGRIVGRVTGRLDEVGEQGERLRITVNDRLRDPTAEDTSDGISGDLSEDVTNAPITCERGDTNELVVSYFLGIETSLNVGEPFMFAASASGATGDYTVEIQSLTKDDCPEDEDCGGAVARDPVGQSNSTLGVGADEDGVFRLVWLDLQIPGPANTATDGTITANVELFVANCIDGSLCGSGTVEITEPIEATLPATAALVIAAQFSQAVIPVPPGSCDDI